MITLTDQLAVDAIEAAETELAQAIAQRISERLDTYGAPPGDSIEERLRAWEQRERALIMLAEECVTRAHRNSDGYIVPVDSLHLLRDFAARNRRERDS